MKYLQEEDAAQTKLILSSLSLLESCKHLVKWFVAVSVLFLQVNIEYKSGLKSFTLTPNRKHLGKSLAIRSTYAILSDLMNNPGSRNYFLKKIRIMLRQELTVMSSHKTKSILSSQDIADMKKFIWRKVLDELSLNAPILIHV